MSSFMLDKTWDTDNDQDFLFVFIDIKIPCIRYLTPFKQAEMIP